MALAALRPWAAAYTDVWRSLEAVHTMVAEVLAVRLLATLLAATSVSAPLVALVLKVGAASLMPLGRLQDPFVSC